MASLFPRPLYDQGLITDVLARVRGGKEASVYRCQGREAGSLVAAKVYRPRRFRSLVTTPATARVGPCSPLTAAP